jgi:hypothetical protein
LKKEESMREKLSSILAASAIALLLSTAPALAEVQTYSADLSGAASVPPNDSMGTGTVIADYDTDTKLFKWSISYDGLTGPATAAHFHGPAGPDENAPPVVPVELELATEAEPAAPMEADPEAPAETPMEAEPATPDEAESASQLSGEATLTDEQAADLEAGRWYFNIHTAEYPDGELRGQLPARAE